MRTFFSATILFLSVRQRALNTSPKVPCPILAIFSYLPNENSTSTEIFNAEKNVELTCRRESSRENRIFQYICRDPKKKFQLDKI
jgi:hypothetical protein